MRYFFWGIVFFWWAMDFYLLVFKRNHQQKVAEKKSKFIVTLLIFAGVLLALVPEGFRATYRQREFGGFQIAGTFVLLAGVAIRFLSVLTLGKHFARDLGVHREKELVTSGLYRWIRHPSYTGEIISFLGVGLVFQHFPASLFITLFPVAAFVYRAIVEEKMLLEEFGSEYEEYRKRTRMFI
ncbi:MAG: isoprenylcysteine carboxylmethyltransferase family protein [Candidatus Saccharicenans sp.]|nr:isoprenylcysteine carboxylmethyltransferase family protein [Candidatus Saccharicenans sp.]